jgi:hypothetical protein
MKVTRIFSGWWRFHTLADSMEKLERQGQSQWGFHECFMHIKYSVTSAKFHFLHETLRREKERVSPW